LIAFTLYKNENSNEWVTFVHGAGGSSSIWFKQIREFQKHFNVLLLDLRGHGNSNQQIKRAFKQKYTFQSIADDVLEVLDHLKIKTSHFIGISLGTIVIRQLAEVHPNRVKSMVMGGAILKMNFRSQILMKLGNIFKYLLPYLVLYRFFAFVIMPNKNHKQSRILFINEAKKLNQQEFIKWFRLSTEVNPLLREFRNTKLDLPCLYIMGNEDAMFLPSIKKLVAAQPQNSKLVIANQCGHVINIDQPNYFNKKVLAFIKVHSTLQLGARLTIIT